MKINKPKLNLSIDIIMFIVMMAIAGIGFMIKYVLIPGFKRNEIYGKDVELYYWGIDRHQWGAVHLILGFALLFLLLLHILFHWKQIIGILKSMVPARFGRIILTALFVIISVAFGIMPLFVKPEIEQGTSHHDSFIEEGNSSHIKERHAKKPNTFQSVATVPDSTLGLKGHSHKNHANQSEVEISGYMTLNKVAKKYNIPVQELASCIHIPQGHEDEKLGRLRKQYGFYLDDLREYIEKNK